MTDIINLLPDSVANQIAAGEVIQRPASVVKELMENSIDALATKIQVILKDGGNTLIQVIDNGKGMSETDARKSFERHATSKIKDADDLFSLRTMGFRGEALPSIAAVAQVEIKTRREEDSLGVFIEIAGTRVFKQETVMCEKGTNIAVKSLFFNVPARRRFLKSQSTEMMHIRNEFYRIVLVHPEIEFSLFDGKNELLQLPETTLKGRIEHVFDLARKKMEQQLLPVSANSQLIDIKGFVGRPEFAQKSANQYFFVNNRYMRHPYFHKAVMVAYEKLIKPGENPNYFIYFDVDPHSIDVNVHPSKTEIKFENEQAIWSIIHAAVRETLGKFQIAPSLDFDQEGNVDIPVLDSKSVILPPKTSFNPQYNPFGSSSSQHKRPDLDWEKLYTDFDKDKNRLKPAFTNDENVIIETDSTQTEISLEPTKTELFQFKSSYICTSVKSGMMLIDQHRAHFRILFDRFIKKIENKKSFSQQVLFPEILELDPNESEAMNTIIDDLNLVGFDIEPFGKNTFSINGVPSEVGVGSSIPLIKDLLASVIQSEIDVKKKVQTQIALHLARQTAIQSGQFMSQNEMNQLFEDLFQCENHLYSPDGKIIMTVIRNEEIERKFR